MKTQEETDGRMQDYVISDGVSVYVMLSQSVVSDCSGHLRKSRKPLVDMTLRWELGKVSPTQYRNLHISKERNHCPMVSCSLCKPCILAMHTCNHTCERLLCQEVNGVD